MRCSKALEHEHVKQRIDAENLCSRPELNPNYMIRLAAVLHLNPTHSKSSRMTPMARGEITSSG